MAVTSYATAIWTRLRDGSWDIKVSNSYGLDTGHKVKVKKRDGTEQEVTVGRVCGHRVMITLLQLRPSKSNHVTEQAGANVLAEITSTAATAICVATVGRIGMMITTKTCWATNLIKKMVNEEGHDIRSARQTRFQGLRRRRLRAQSRLRADVLAPQVPRRARPRSELRLCEWRTDHRVQGLPQRRRGRQGGQKLTKKRDGTEEEVAVSTPSYERRGAASRSTTRSVRPSRSLLGLSSMKPAGMSAA